MSKSLFKCSVCNTEYSRWQGQCSTCGEWNTIDEVFTKTTKGSGTNAVASQITKISDLTDDKLDRIDTSFSELNRVLGSTNPFSKKIVSGLAKGSVNLISGDPGIGKSTLLLQVANALASGGYKTFYISAEESLIQIGMRAKRLGIKKTELDKINFINEYDVDSVLAALAQENPEFVIIDSVQTLSSQAFAGLPGGMSQVKGVSSRLIQFAKSNDVSMFIIGHINKEGNVAGPKILEHLVDGVFQLEGDKKTDLRILRSLKNRFGATNEVGVFRMDEAGMHDVDNPSDYFLTGDLLPGVSRGIVMEGNRSLIVEVQSLIVPTVFPLPKRLGEGVSIPRIQLICAIVQRYMRVNLSDKDVYINIAGGLKVNDRGLDLAIAASLLSSFKNIALPKDMVFLGEIALTGKVTKSISETIKLKEASRMGYKIYKSSNSPELTSLNKLF